MKSSPFFKAHPIPSICIGIGILAIGAGVWRQTIVSALEADATVKEAEANKLADNVRYAQKLDTQLAELAEINKQVQARLTDPGDLASNQQYFYSAEAETGVKIAELRRASAPQKKTGKATYSTISYTVSVEGEFPAAVAFLRKIESGSRISRIVSGSMITRVNTMTEYVESPSLNTVLEVEFLTP
jgi:hypothetical protein